jgi:predicted small lipoprotein YifL
MKKIICVLVIGLLVLSLCACGNTETTDTPPKDTSSDVTPSSQQSEEPSNTNSPVTKDLFGYKYSFPTDISIDSSADGALVECKNATVLIFNLDVVDFTSWDSIIDDSEYEFFGAINSAFHFYPNSQNAVSTTEENSDFNEKMLHVEGTFDTSNGDKEFIAYYHVTNENKVRFFISVVDGNKDNVKSVTEYIAKNLAKA